MVDRRDLELRLRACVAVHAQRKGDALGEMRRGFRAHEQQMNALLRRGLLDGQRLAIGLQGEGAFRRSVTSVVVSQTRISSSVPATVPASIASMSLR